MVACMPDSFECLSIFNIASSTQNLISHEPAGSADDQSYIIMIIMITVSANPKPEGHRAYTQSVCSHICGA